MKILMLGDVTSPAAAEYLASRLPEEKKNLSADLVTVNAENAGFIYGPGPDTVSLLLGAGADVITGGNHTLQNYLLQQQIAYLPRALRPANYPRLTPGRGYTIVTVKGLRVLVMNLLGRVHIEPPLNSPFEAADRIFYREKGNYDLAILDFHAEATGEKMALAYYLSSRLAVFAGTHTHIPTADMKILPGGCGYVSDLGMCGAEGGIMGIKKECVIDRYLTGVGGKFVAAEGKITADGVLFTVDEKTKRTVAIERVIL